MTTKFIENRKVGRNCLVNPKLSNQPKEDLATYVAIFSLKVGSLVFFIENLAGSLASPSNPPCALQNLFNFLSLALVIGIKILKGFLDYQL